MSSRPTRQNGKWTIQQIFCLSKISEKSQNISSFMPHWKWTEFLCKLTKTFVLFYNPYKRSKKYQHWEVRHWCTDVSHRIANSCSFTRNPYRFNFISYRYECIIYSIFNAMWTWIQHSNVIYQTKHLLAWSSNWQRIEYISVKALNFQMVNNPKQAMKIRVNIRT